jgi:ribosomal protein S18 acetylase RimI-like enzyme
MSSDAISVRVSEGSRDRAAIRHLFVELQEHGRAFDDRLAPGNEIADAYFESLLLRCSECEGHFLVAELSGEVCGYICVLAKAPCTEPADGLSEQAEVVDLVVSRQARSAGVGKALIESAEALAASAGARFLRVSVFANNYSAAAFYEHIGFTAHEVIYEKQLSPRTSHGE